MTKTMLDVKTLSLKLEKISRFDRKFANSYYYVKYDETARQQFTGKLTVLMANGGTSRLVPRVNMIAKTFNADLYLPSCSIDLSWEQIGQNVDGENVGDYSGTSVALSDDGSVLAVGATYNDGIGSENSGHVHVYKNVNVSWEQTGQDIGGESAGDMSGYSVALSNDGSVLAIGSVGAPENDGNSYFSRHIRVYQNVNGIWQQIGQDVDGENVLDNFGWSVALSDDGSVLAVGAYSNGGNGSFSGHVRVFELN